MHKICYKYARIRVNRYLNAFPHRHHFIRHSLSSCFTVAQQFACNALVPLFSLTKSLAEAPAEAVSCSAVSENFLLAFSRTFNSPSNRHQTRDDHHHNGHPAHEMFGMSNWMFGRNISMFGKSDQSHPDQGRLHPSQICGLHAETVGIIEDLWWLQSSRRFLAWKCLMPSVRHLSTAGANNASHLR